MAYVVVASVRSNFTPSDGDCTVIQSLVELLSWTQVNDRAASAITTAKFFPLTTPYLKRVIDRLGSVVCGGSRALGDTAFLIGQGSSLQSVNDWVQAYSSDKFVLKYFTSNTVTALNSLAKGTLLQHLVERWQDRALMRMCFCTNRRSGFRPWRQGRVWPPLFL